MYIILSEAQRSAVGRESFYYQGMPELLELDQEGNMLEYWYFEFPLIENDVQQNLIKYTAYHYGLTDDDAEAYLTRMNFSVPRDEVINL